MTRQQSTIIWLGLTLIAMNIIVHWSQLRTVIFGSGVSATLASKTTPTGGAALSATTAQTPATTPTNVQVTL